jgi:3-oxoacyl-[acyl-carrier-protein] synthase II
MRAALADAQVTPESIDYVNAHGTSTPANDRNETAALKAVFGERAREFVISSTKSMTGHMLGAAGAVETAVCALACSRGVMPPTINYSEPDPECDLNYNTDGPVEGHVGTAISNSFGFGGHNVCIVITRWTGS